MSGVSTRACSSVVPASSTFAPPSIRARAASTSPAAAATHSGSCVLSSSGSGAGILGRRAQGDVGAICLTLPRVRYAPSSLHRTICRSSWHRGGGCCRRISKQHAASKALRACDARCLLSHPEAFFENSILLISGDEGESSEAAGGRPHAPVDEKGRRTERERRLYP
jgi:hypothetical protein